MAAHLSLTSHGPADTARIGGTLAALLRPGDLVLLRGELGAGKTTLARAIAAGLGADRSPGSPTFVIAHELPLPDGARLVHMDAYRLDAHADLADIGWDRLAAPDAILLIEWPERLREHPDAARQLLAREAAAIDLTHTGAEERRLDLAAPDGWTRRDAWPAIAALDTDPRLPTTCPVTGRHVPADAPTWPFADERARLADLYRWFSESYTISRPIEERDLDEGDAHDPRPSPR